MDFHYPTASVAAKLQHALGDGRVSAKIITDSLQKTSDPAPGFPTDEPNVAEIIPGRRELLKDAWPDDIALIKGAPRMVLRTLRYMGKALWRKIRRKPGYAGAFSGLATHFNQKLTPFGIWRNSFPLKWKNCWRPHALWPLTTSKRKLDRITHSFQLISAPEQGASARSCLLVTMAMRWRCGCLRRRPCPMVWAWVLPTTMEKSTWRFATATNCSAMTP
jgi:hypothetical protein